MPASIYKGGWRNISKISIFKGGGWHDVSGGWIGKGGVWVRFLASVNAVAAWSRDHVLSPGTATCSVTFNAVGTCTRVGDTGHTTFNWLLGGAASAYDIRWDGSVTSGVGSVGGSLAVATWGNLASNRSISLTKSSGTGTVQWDGTYSIALAGTGVAIASNTLGLTCIRDA